MRTQRVTLHEWQRRTVGSIIVNVHTVLALFARHSFKRIWREECQMKQTANCVWHSSLLLALPFHPAVSPCDSLSWCLQPPARCLLIMIHWESHRIEWFHYRSDGVWFDYSCAMRAKTVSLTLTSPLRPCEGERVVEKSVKFTDNCSVICDNSFYRMKRMHVRQVSVVNKVINGFWTSEKLEKSVSALHRKRVTLLWW